MSTFREFLENSQEEEDKDILHTLSKIPDSHAALVKGYKFKFQGGNTLDGDNEHIGYVQTNPKEIVVAAPWNYSREFTLLHEIGHQVYDRLPDSLKHQWKVIVLHTKNRQKQSPEELFCMAYAAFYCKNPPAIHYHKEWLRFIDNLPQ